MFDELLARRGLSIDRLHAFLKVAEAGGIARAVGDDAVRQSQFSRQIKELETFFGTTLFSRQAKSLRLTPMGERLAYLARESFGALRDFGKSCADEPIDFTIGAGDSLLHWLIIPRLGELQREFSHVKLRLRNLQGDDIVRGLHEGQIDFGIVRRDAVSKPLVNASLGSLDYSVYVPRKLMPAGRARDYAWALSALPVATLANSGQFNKRLKSLQAKGPSIARFALECESFPQALAAFNSGHYAAILPRISAASISLPFTELEAPPLNQPRRSIVLAWSPRTLVIRDHAVSLCENLAKKLTF